MFFHILLLSCIFMWNTGLQQATNLVQAVEFNWQIWVGKLEHHISCYKTKVKDFDVIVVNSIPFNTNSGSDDHLYKDPPGSATYNIEPLALVLCHWTFLKICYISFFHYWMQIKLYVINTYQMFFLIHALKKLTLTIRLTILELQLVFPKLTIPCKWAMPFFTSNNGEPESP